MIHIVGTAHVSKESVDEVRTTILDMRPDVVAVELCQARHDGLLDQRDIPVLDLIKSGNSLLFVVNMLLSFFQKRIGDEMGITPGREMLVAMDSASEVGARVALIDRDIKITLSRAIGNMGLREKLRLVKELFFSLFASGEEVDIEDLKKDENLVDILEGFKDVAPSLYSSLVDERDAYMASRLLALSNVNENIVSVVGAGHKRGIERYLASPESLPDIASLETKKKGYFFKTLKYAIPAAIIASFVLAFSKGIDIQGSILLWIAYNAVPTGIGVAVAGGHPISILVGMLASPLTSLNPLLAAGWFAGLSEAKIRRTTVGDVKEMFKISGYRELYRNRAFKVLLVAALANIGSTIGTFTFIPKVLVPMLKGVFS
jgi:pheromone shutdown-related protein TraB